MQKRIAVDDNARAVAARAEVSDQQQAAWRDRMAAKDRLNEQVRDAIGGQQRFTDLADPGRAVVLPDTYKHARSDGQGHYVLTDDGNYNPRPQPGTFDGKWEPMRHP